MRATLSAKIVMLNPLNAHMPFFRTPRLLQSFLPCCHWRISPKTLSYRAPTLLLTFDDGPVPQVTPLVLDLLARYQAKATFFCVGDNVRKHPGLFKELIAAGHSVGNHTFHHVKGWQTSLRTYLEEVASCQHIMEETAGMPLSRFFRPPYGRISLQQLKALYPSYHIVMWDLLTHDYDPRLTAQQLYHPICQRLRHGSIIVFHDSLKARDRLLPLLSYLLDYACSNGFHFENLNQVLTPYPPQHIQAAQSA